VGQADGAGIGTSGTSKIELGGEGLPTTSMGIEDVRIHSDGVAGFSANNNGVLSSDRAGG